VGDAGRYVGPSALVILTGRIPRPTPPHRAKNARWGPRFGLGWYMSRRWRLKAAIAVCVLDILGGSDPAHDDETVMNGAPKMFVG